jgi:hypothetical protein
MTTMANHSSASVREHTPHANQTTRTATVVGALKRRALAVLNDENKDVHSTSGTIVFDPESEPPGYHSSREKIEALADIICGGGEGSAGALLVLMGQMENSDNPQAMVNTVKHFAFTRCGELNLRGMVDTHIVMLEDELLRGNIRPDSAVTSEMES